MLSQCSLRKQLAQQHIAELHEAASRERLARRIAGPQRMRVYAGRVLIAVGTRLGATETPATNRMTKVAGR